MQSTELFSPFGDYYEISNFGYVVSKAGIYTTSTGRRLNKKGKKIKTFLSKKGYARIPLYSNGKQRNLALHRLVAIAFIPNPENKPQVNHKDGNKLNNHVSNLEWMTNQENEDHAFGTGLKNSTGSNNTQAKLNEEKVRLIRNLYNSGVSTKSISASFKIDLSNIQRIVNGERWKHA